MVVRGGVRWRVGGVLAAQGGISSTSRLLQAEQTEEIRGYVWLEGHLNFGCNGYVIVTGNLINFHPIDPSMVPCVANTGHM